MWPFTSRKSKLEVLADRLRSEDAEKRSRAAADLRSIGNADAMRVLFDALADGREDTRKAVCEVLTVKDIPALEALGERAEERLCTVFKYGSLDESVCEALARCGGGLAEKTLCEDLINDDADKTYKLMCDFANIPYVPGHVPATIVQIRHKTHSPGRLATLKALGQCGGVESIPALKAALVDDDPAVSKAAADLLKHPRFTQAAETTHGAAVPSQSAPETKVAPDSSAPTGYGLSVTNPVLVPGGTTEGAANEKKYLSRLRCPNGSPVEFSRRGSVNPMMAAMSEGDAEAKEAIMAQLSEALTKVGPGGLPAKYRSVDVYDVKCTCGEHEVTVYMSMYEHGPDEPIGTVGWTRVDPHA